MRVSKDNARRSASRCGVGRTLWSGLVAAFLLAACAAPRLPAPRPPAPAPAPSPRPALPPRHTLEGALARLAGPAEERLRPPFSRARVPFPPRRAWLLAFKEERKLELWAQRDGRPAFIRSYRILAASGEPGPKLREGDLQVPEGLYRVLWLNPASSYHLSLRLDYPNGFDRAKASAEGRTDLGGDIFIHGSDVSEGCLAMGDAAIEELFVLAARIGVANMDVVIAPRDLREGPAPASLDSGPEWLPELYATIRTELGRFQL